MHTDVIDTYEIKKSQAVDMFPHTHHIENMMLIILKLNTI